MEPEGSLPHSQAPATQRKHPACKYFLTWMFYREGLLAHRPTPKLEDHPLSAFHDCLFNLFAATLHIGGRSSIRNLRTRHAVVTGTHYTWYVYNLTGKYFFSWLNPCAQNGFHHCNTPFVFRLFFLFLTSFVTGWRGPRASGEINCM